MKLLVDMNLSPSWVERLARHGFEAVHWSTIGAATSLDHEILEWAHEHDFVVITNDLDFSAILAAGAVGRAQCGADPLKTCFPTVPSALSPRRPKRTETTSSEAHSCRLTKGGRA